MESVHQPKVNLSFSIENILRDDFPHRQRANGCNFISQHESSFQRWSNTAVYPPYHAVHYSPVIVKSLPNRPQGQILFEEHNKMDDCSNCKHEALRHENDPKINNREVKEFFNSKACRNGVGAQKRKRRNRSHFTQHQLQYLERLFSCQKYLTRDERMVLARSLDMTELQIRNWFQNRRYLKRRRANENSKQDKPAEILPRVLRFKTDKEPRCFVELK